MTATSTAYLFVSPQGAGPFNGPAWRIGNTAQLVEGSGAPYWLCRSPDTSEDRFVPIPVMNGWTMAQSVLFLLALGFADETQLKFFEDHHNITRQQDAWKVAECWDLSDEEIEMATHIVNGRIRIGIALLDEDSLLDSDAVHEIRALGIELDVFGLH